jgi:hypothetical protein
LRSATASSTAPDAHADGGTASRVRGAPRLRREPYTVVAPAPIGCAGTAIGGDDGCMPIACQTASERAGITDL